MKPKTPKASNALGHKHASSIIEISNRESVYICDALQNLRDMVGYLVVSKEIKLALLESIERCQLFANKMEDAIISKNVMLEQAGYEKCPHCFNWSKIDRDEIGNYYYCCGMPYRS